MSVQQSSCFCMICRSVLQEQIDEIKSNEKKTAFNNQDEIKSSLKVLCKLLDVSLNPDNEDNDDVAFPLCVDCSEVLFNLATLQALVDRTRMSIDEKLLWIKGKISESETIGVFSDGSISNKEIDLIRQAALSSPADEENNQDIFLEEDLKLEIESLGGERHNDDNDFGIDFDFNSMNDEVDEGGDYEAGLINTIPNLETVDNFDDGSTTLVPKNVQTKPKSAKLRKKFNKLRNVSSQNLKKQSKNEKALQSIKKSQRIRRKNNKYLEDPKTKESTTKRKIVLSQFEIDLIKKFGLDKTPELKIELVDMNSNKSLQQGSYQKILRKRKQKSGDSETELANEDEDTIEDLNENDPDYEEPRPKVKNISKFPQIKRRKMGTKRKERQEDVKVFGPTPLKRRRRYPPVTLNSIVIMDGKKFYLNHEIKEENNQLICGIQDCTFTVDKGDDETLACKTMLAHIKSVKHSKKVLLPNLSCTPCQKVFKNIRGYRRHNSIAHSNNTESRILDTSTIPCDICQRPLRPSSLIPHKWTHYNAQEVEEQKKLNNNVDPRSNNKRKTLLEQELFKNRFKCDKCEKTFSQKSYLKAHEIVHVPRKDRELHICEVCGQTFTTPRGLTIHNQKFHHPNKYMAKWIFCPICNEKFWVKTHFNIHMRRYHGAEKPYKCDICDRQFAAKDELKHHAVVHLPDRQFKCQYCPTEYRYVKNLYRHIKRAHKDQESHRPTVENYTERPKPIRQPLPVHTCKQMYPCPYCDKPFELPSRLKKHLVVHTGEKSQTKKRVSVKSSKTRETLVEESEDEEDDEASEEDSNDIAEDYTVSNTVEVSSVRTQSSEHSQPMFRLNLVVDEYPLAEYRLS